MMTSSGFGDIEPLLWCVILLYNAMILCAHDHTLVACDCLCISPPIHPMLAIWLSTTSSSLSLFTRHLTLSLSHFTMQTTQETKSSISSSVYGIQQLFRDFEKQCHILTKPATEGTLTTPTLLLVDLIQPTPINKKRSTHSVLSILTMHDKSLCSTLTPFDRYVLSSRLKY